MQADHLSPGLNEFDKNLLVFKHSNQMGVIKQTLREESLGNLNNMGESSLCKLSPGLNEFDHFLSASTWPGLGAFQTNTVCISRIQNF